jgi:hypothetical protein
VSTTDLEREERAKITALKADALHLATLCNAYAGNLEILLKMRELSHSVLSQLRRRELSAQPMDPVDPAKGGE